MTAFHSFTRGGQLALHQIRMIKQVFMVTAVVSVLIGTLIGCTFFIVKTNHRQRTLFLSYLMAHVQVKTTLHTAHRPTQMFRGRVVHAQTLLQSGWVQREVGNLQQMLWQALKIGLWSFLGTALSTVIYFVIRGQVTTRKKLERGARLVTPKNLRRRIKRAKQASHLTLDGFPLLKDKETSHTLITGTTGSGKTNALHTILLQLRRHQGRAIIVDLTGDFVSRYYEEGRDILLNPFDVRSQTWNPWAECLCESHYDTLAAAIIPKTGSTEPFWENAGKALLATALKELAKREEKDTESLYDILVRKDLATFSKFFQHTDAAPYTHADGEKMTFSIRATLANHLQGFRFLKKRAEDFSLRKWVTDIPDTEGWLFLSARPDQRETLRPLLSGWLDTALNALLSLPPDATRRLWFVMDELPALQRLPSLETALAESRKYGGCFLAGLQSVAQLATLYGHTSSRAILDLFNTKIFFRNTDPGTTEWISKVLGEAECTEHVENLSYGANTMRDGVTLAKHTHTKPLVLPSEMSALKDCEAYFKLPGDWPVTKHQMTYKNVRPITEAFVADSPENAS